MKIRFLFFLFSLTLVNSASLMAEGSSCGFAAELIYWEPLSNDRDYVFKGNMNLTTVVSDNTDLKFKGRYQDVNHCFYPGFRVSLKGSNLVNCWNGGLSYTYFESSRSDRTSNRLDDRLIPIQIHGGLDSQGCGDLVRARHTIRYHSGEATLSQNLPICPDQFIVLSWGLQGIDCDQRMRTRVFEDDDLNYVIDWEGEVSGVGLLIGSDYRYFVSQGCGIFMKSSLSVLITHIHNNFKQKRKNLPPDEMQNIHIETDKNHLFPGIHLMVGIDSDFCIRNWYIHWALGYEVLDWWNAPHPRHFFIAERNVGHGTASTGDHLGFHGPFFKLGSVF